MSFMAGRRGVLLRTPILRLTWALRFWCSLLPHCTRSVHVTPQTRLDYMKSLPNLTQSSRVNWGVDPNNAWSGRETSEGCDASVELLCARVANQTVAYGRSSSPLEDGIWQHSASS